MGILQRRRAEDLLATMWRVAEVVEVGEVGVRGRLLAVFTGCVEGCQRFKAGGEATRVLACHSRGADMFFRVSE